MLKRTLLTALAASGMLAFAASAQAAYLQLGTSNVSNATTTLSGSTVGSELVVKNSNGVSTNAFGLYGLLTATSPTVTVGAVRGANNATNARGYGVWGSQAGSGSGVYGFTPSGRGVWGNSTSGIGVRGSSSTGTGVYGTHAATTGTNPGVRGDTGSTAANAAGVYGLVSSSSPGANSPGVLGVNEGTGYDGVGVYGSQAGKGAGVYGTSAGTGVIGASSGYLRAGVYGTNPSGDGVRGYGDEGVAGYGGTDGVYGSGGLFGNGVRGVGGDGPGIYGTSDRTAIVGHVQSAAPYAGVWGKNDSSGFGVLAESKSGDAISATSASATGSGIYAEETGASGRAGWFQGSVYISGGCTGCAGAALKIDHPLDPAHKYLQHSTVVSPQMKDIYDGLVTTDAKGFATVTMPRWFQAVNRTFRYQLTIIGTGGWNARVVKEIAHNRFTIQTDTSAVKVSWQVTGIRHDRYANAHPVQVVVAKAKSDQGKYLYPELYGKPKTETIGYRKAPMLPDSPSQKH